MLGNWKMNIDILPEAKKLVQTVKKKTAKVRKTDIVFCPPTIYLQALAPMMKGKWKLGAQNAFYEQTGAYTGEISAPQLRQFDISYVIVGHSERRIMDETDGIVSKKAQAVLRAGFTSVVCIGETVRSEDGEHLHFIKNQLEKSLAGVSKSQIGDVVIAYEPVWAIGAKDAMNPGDIHEMTLYIKKCLNTLFGTYANGVKILYGGAVNSENTKDIIQKGFVDGLLVGRDSLDADKFSQIINIVDKA